MATNQIDYCTYTLNDIQQLSDDLWIIFSEDMSTGMFESYSEAKECNTDFLGWENVEYITIEEFKRRLVLDPGLELEDF